MRRPCDGWCQDCLSSDIIVIFARELGELQLALEGRGLGTSDV